MKKIIITILIASSISLGFTLIDKNTHKTKVTDVETVKVGDFEKADVLAKEQDKRLASWD